MTDLQCTWCPWECPSPSVAARRAISPEPSEPAQSEPASQETAICEPSWVAPRGRGARKRTTDVLRDLADYSAPQPTAEAVDGP